MIASFYVIALQLLRSSANKKYLPLLSAVQYFLLYEIYLARAKFCEKCNFPLVAFGYPGEGTKLYFGQKMSQSRTEKD